MMPNAVSPWLTGLLSFAFHRLPLKSGVAKISNSRLVRGLVRGDEGKRRATLRNGSRLVVDTADYNGRMIYLFGTVDPKVVEACRSLLRPGDGFFDIGANYGTVGLLCSDAVEPGGAIHLFEPQPDLCDAIAEAIEGAGSRHVRLHRCGLMDRDADLPFRCAEGHSGRGSFVAQLDQTSRETTFTARDIATYLPPLIGDRPFGVKLDVEGAELLLLPWLLEQPGLRFAIFESSHLGDSPSLLDRLGRAGFVLLGLENSLLTVRVTLVDGPEALRRFHDVIAVRRPTGYDFPRKGRLRDVARRMG